MTIRPGTLADAETIVAQRRAMFDEIGLGNPKLLDQMCDAFRPWLTSKIKSGHYLAWFAVAPTGAIAAGAGLWLMDWPPLPFGLGAARGNIVNVYTDPAFRRAGLARQLMTTIIDHCRANAIDAVILHSSDFGRPLYESLGFKTTNEMRLFLKPPVSRK